MKITIDNIDGDVVKQDDRYTVTDNTTLNKLVVSSTNLLPNKSTTGHRHQGQEEVYYFVKGGATMELDGKQMVVKEGDVVLIEDGVFHKVNAHKDGCYFVCVFDGVRSQ
jgi:mannose-6-phosphate isomerase-like protein (cupin superfamily)